MKACPRITTLAVRFVFTPRIGLSRALSRPWSHSTRLVSYWLLGAFFPQIREMPVPQPGPGQILVKIEASGLCHDIHAARGDWP